MSQLVDDPTLDQLCDHLTIANGYVQLLLFLLWHHPAELDPALLSLYLRRARWGSARVAATLRGESFTEPWPG